MSNFKQSLALVGLVDLDLSFSPLRRLQVSEGMLFQLLTLDGQLEQPLFGALTGGDASDGNL